MLPRGTLASAPHARSADRYTPGPAIVHAIVLCCLPAIRRFCRARRVHNVHVCDVRTRGDTRAMCGVPIVVAERAARAVRSRRVSRFATGRSFPAFSPSPFSSVFQRFPRGPAGRRAQLSASPPVGPAPARNEAIRPAPAPTPQSDRRHTRSPNQTRAHGLRDQPGL
jgi:hypothetical protein